MESVPPMNRFLLHGQWIDKKTYISPLTTINHYIPSIVITNIIPIINGYSD